MVKVNGKVIEWTVRCGGVHHLELSRDMFGLTCEVISSSLHKNIWHCYCVSKFNQVSFTETTTWQAARRAVEAELKRRLAVMEVVL